MAKITFEALQGGYPDKRVFNNLELTLPEGKLIALTGPNGSGKSTLLKFIYRELKPLGGTVRLDSKNLATLSQRELARRLGFVAQHASIDYAFTVRQAVEMGRYAHSLASSQAIVEEAMQECSIDHLADTLVTTLSGGELQRVMLARALAQQGRLLLFDEPVNHLDVKHQRSIMELLTRLVERGYTVICVLHDLLLVQIYSEITLVLNHGTVVAQGETEQVFTQQLLNDVWHVQAHRIYDPVLGRTLWLPTHTGG
jgi:iron complex transport system ATP-binding protein